MFFIVKNKFPRRSVGTENCLLQTDNYVFNAAQLVRQLSYPMTCPF